MLLLLHIHGHYLFAEMSDLLILLVSGHHWVYWLPDNTDLLILLI